MKKKTKTSLSVGCNLNIIKEKKLIAYIEYMNSKGYTNASLVRILLSKEMNSDVEFNNIYSDTDVIVKEVEPKQEVKQPVEVKQEIETVEVEEEATTIEETVNVENETPTDDSISEEIINKLDHISNSNTNNNPLFARKKLNK